MCYLLGESKAPQFWIDSSRGKFEVHMLGGPMKIVEGLAFYFPHAVNEQAVISDA